MLNVVSQWLFGAVIALGLIVIVLLWIILGWGLGLVLGTKLGQIMAYKKGHPYDQKEQS